MRFLSQVFAAALLLSLTVAAPTPACECGCDHLNKTLADEEFDTIFGKWILHEAYVSSSFEDFKLNVNSSTAEVIRSADNQTVTLKHAYMVNETCVRFSVNYTVDGNTLKYTNPTSNGTSEADFLKTCDDCLTLRDNMVTCDGRKGTILFFYRKQEIVPQDDQEAASKQAKCLGFLQPPQFIYKQTELCPEESVDTKAKEPEQ